MGTYLIVCLAVVLLVVAIGGYLVRRHHKRRTANRERRWKIAAGEIREDDAELQSSPPEEEEAVPGRKRWYQLRGGKPRLTKKLWEQIKTLDKLIEEVLQLWPGFTRAGAELRAVEEQTSRASSVPRSVDALLPYVNPEDAASFRGWCLQAVDAYRASSEARRAYVLAQDDFNAAIGPLYNKMVEVAEIVVDADAYDLADVPPRIRTMLTLARHVRFDRSVQKEGRNQDYDYRHAQPIVPDAVADERCRSIFDSDAKLLGDMLATARRVNQLAGETRRARDRWKELQSSPRWAEPQKPVEQDVQSLTVSAAEWGSSLHSIEVELRAKLEELDQVFRQALALNNRVSGILSHVKERHHRLYADGTPWQPEPTDPAEDRKNKGKHKNAKIKPVKPPAPPQPPTYYFIGDEAQAMLDVAGVVYAASVKLVAGAQEGLPSIYDLPRVYEAQPNDEANCASLKAAARKLGFAVAQRNAAKLKLEAAQAEPKGSVVVDAVPFDTRDVDVFIRAHVRHREQLAHNQALKEKESAKIAPLEKTLADRTGQMHQAAEALWVLMRDSGVNRRERQPELDALYRGFWELYQRFKKPPPPSHSSCGSSYPSSCGSSSF